MNQRSGGFVNSRTPAAAAPGRAGVQGAEPLGINLSEYQSTVKMLIQKYIYQIMSERTAAHDVPGYDVRLLITMYVDDVCLLCRLRVLSLTDLHPCRHFAWG